MERICGICSHIHATAYALGVEQLAGITAPPRAQAIRVLFAEMERIHSHLLWLGVAAHQAGLDTLFMFTWRDRETIMNLLDEVSGNRVNYSVNVLGGVKYDIDDPRADAIRRGVDSLERRIHHYLDIVTADESFLRRTRGVGFSRRRRLMSWESSAPLHGRQGSCGMCAWTRLTAPTGISRRPRSRIRDATSPRTLSFGSRSFSNAAV